MARAYVHNYAPREGDLVSGVIKWTPRKCDRD